MTCHTMEFFMTEEKFIYQWQLRKYKVSAIAVTEQTKIAVVKIL